jgi:hypothetical protein
MLLSWTMVENVRQVFISYNRNGAATCAHLMALIMNACSPRAFIHSKDARIWCRGPSAGL